MNDDMYPLSALTQEGGRDEYFNRTTHTRLDYDRKQHLFVQIASVLPSLSAGAHKSNQAVEEFKCLWHTPTNEGGRDES
jgi:hypothetical protein